MRQMAGKEPLLCGLVNSHYIGYGHSGGQPTHYACICDQGVVDQREDLTTTFFLTLYTGLHNFYINHQQHEHFFNRF